MNCWEFKKCGREEGGKRAKELGVCPAYPDHGKHCARIAGTLCDDEVQGTFARKLGDCLECDFYDSAYYDVDWQPLAVMLKKIKETQSS